MAGLQSQAAGRICVTLERSSVKERICFWFLWYDSGFR